MSRVETDLYHIATDLMSRERARRRLLAEALKRVTPTAPLALWYKCRMSHALDQLEVGLKELRDLEDLVQLKTGGTKGPTAGIAAARRSATLLLNSHFEAYLEDVLDDSMQAINPGFDISKIRRDFMTPRTDNIDKLFLLLGINKISHSLSWQGAANKSIRKTINELQDARNAIAHGEYGAKATKSDLNRFRSYVLGFCTAVDSIIATRISTMTGGPEPW